MSRYHAPFLALSLLLAATPASTMAQPGRVAALQPGVMVHPFRIGRLQAFALRDGLFQPPNNRQDFVTGASVEDVAAVLRAAGQPTDHFDLGGQPMLVRAGARTLLFDTGGGALNGDAAGRLPLSMAAARIAPGSVTDIFISHMHDDHIGGLVDANGGLAYPNARIHIAAAEWEAYRRSLMTLRGPRAARLQALASAIEPKVAPFRPNAVLIPGLVRAVDVRGHTPGHSAYRITGGRASLVYVGDSMHHFVTSVQRPAWQISFDQDHSTASVSRAALLARLAASQKRIYAVHFPFPGIGRIGRRGGGFVWVPER